MRSWRSAYGKLVWQRNMRSVGVGSSRVRISLGESSTPDLTKGLGSPSLEADLGESIQWRI
jgi:hypothetical protein